jgi:membrane associated rhomboid family serine protease
LSHVVFNWASPIPVVGASGAIAGVMGAYMLLFPHARIDCVLWFVIITFVEVPAIFFLIVWFVSQFLVYNPGVAYSGAYWRFRGGVPHHQVAGRRRAHPARATTLVLRRLVIQ